MKRHLPWLFLASAAVPLATLVARAQPRLRDKATGIGAYVFLGFLEKFGFGVPVGGSGKLTDALIACIEVFALGGKGPDDDAAETGYFAVRAALARAVSDAAQFLASQAAASEGAPALLRLVGLVAARFHLQVSEKVAAQAVPVIGAAGGALINLMFIDHYQDVSRGHFTVRRLERLYGEDVVRRAYDALAGGR